MQDLDYVREAFPRYAAKNPHDSIHDLERSLETGGVTPVVLHDDRGPCGFLLLRPLKNELYVVVLYFDRPYPHDRVMEFVDETARQWGCDGIRMRSSRPGMQRQLEKFGFHREPIYEMCKEVPHG